MAVKVQPMNDFMEEVCCNCSVRFAMTRNLYDLRKDDGDSFYCPNGHKQKYTELESTRLKKKLAASEEESKRHERWYRDEQKRSLRYDRTNIALRGHITRLKNA